MIEDSASDVHYVQPFLGCGRGRGAAQDTFRSKLHESMEAGWFIDNPVGLDLLNQLRMCVADAFDSESESVPAVFHFLIDFKKKKQNAPGGDL